MGKSAIMSVRITGNADDAIKALGKVTSKAAAFGSAVGGIAAKGVSRLWDTVSQFTGQAADMSDSLQKFQSTMSFAGFDTSAIDQASKATRDYADKTVYDLTTVQNTTAQLAANGIKDYVGLTKAAGNLNAVAGGNAQTFGSVAMVLTQTAGAGKLTTENWNQLADAIPGASGKLQDALKENGAYTGDFRDAMAKGEITADEFNKAITDLGFTDAAQEAATSTKTMEGAMGNLEAAITGGLADAFDVIKPTVTDAMSGMADAISDGTGKAVAWLKDATAWAGDFIKSLQDTGALGRFAEAAGRLGDGIKKVADSIGGVLSKFTDPFRKLADTAMDAARPLTQAGDAGKAAGDAIDRLTGITDSLTKTLGGMSDWFDQHAEPIQTALAAIAGGFAAFRTASLISTAVTALQGFSLATTTASIAQAALNLVMSLNPIMLVVTAFGALTAGIVWWVTQTETGRKTWDAMCTGIRTAAQAVVDWLQGVPGKVEGFFNGIGDWFATRFNQVRDSITGAFGKAADWVRGVPDRITGAFNGIGDWFATRFNQVKDGITSGFDTAAEWVKGIPDRIKDVFRDAGEWLKDAGRRIIQGLSDGIKGKWDDVKDWFGGVGDWIVQHKGPPSKDATLLTRNGRLIMQGLAKGLDQGLATSVTRSIGRITQTIAGTPLGIATPTTGTQPGMGRAGQVSITINGALAGSEDQLAAWIRRALDDYQRRRS